MKNGNPDKPLLLARTQAKQSQQLQRVERLQAQLGAQTQKLAVVEARLATLASPPASNRRKSAAAKARSVPVLVNLHAGQIEKHKSRIEEMVAAFRRYGIEAAIHVEESGEAARAWACQVAQRQEELLVVAGGDGSLEDICPALVGSQTALGILPAGTMNNLAWALGVPLDLEAACRLIAMGTIRHIDVGRISSGTPEGSDYFLESAGVGLSAVAAQVAQKLEDGRWAALTKLLGRFVTFQAPDITVESEDGAPFEVATQMVTCSNAPLFGRHMLVAPDAKMDDGLLDLAIYEGMTHFDLERYFTAIAGGRRVDDPHASLRRVRKLRLSAGHSLAANSDLDVLPAQATWEIDVVPRGLAVVVGNSQALTIPVAALPPLGPFPEQQKAPSQERGTQE